MRRFLLFTAAAATALPQPGWARDGGAPFPERESADGGRALQCLTQAIYYEARNQSADGQRAVAQVVLNRTRHPDYPASVCGVVFQGSQRTTGCQFSFTCDGSMNAGVRDGRAWDRAERIAAAALAGSVYRPVGGALNYHTTAILPYWAPSLVQQAVIGDHIFYRRPNGVGDNPTPLRITIERPDEPDWSARDSAVLRRALRSTRSPRLREIGMVIEEIPVLEQPVRYRSFGGRGALQPQRSSRRRAAPAPTGPRMAIESGVRVSRGS